MAAANRANLDAQLVEIAIEQGLEPALKIEEFMDLESGMQMVRAKKMSGRTGTEVRKAASDSVYTVNAEPKVVVETEKPKAPASETASRPAYTPTPVTDIPPSEWTIENLQALGSTPVQPVEEPAAEVRSPKHSEIRPKDDKEWTPLWKHYENASAIVKPWRAEDSKDNTIDFGAVADEAGEKLAKQLTENRFFIKGDESTLASAKLRGASERKHRSLEGTLETSVPYRSMSSSNVGNYTVEGLQKDILYDFIERNTEELSKSTGITGFFKRRSLKRKLHDLTRTACLWHWNDTNEQIENDYRTIQDGVADVLETLVSNKQLAKDYKAGKTLAAAKDAVDKAYAPKPATQSTQEVEPASFWKKAAAYAALAATVFTMGAPADNAMYSQNMTTANDDNIMDVEDADDVFVSYATTAPEMADAYDPEPTPEPRRGSRRARPSPAPEPEPEHSYDHLNPQVMEVGRYVSPEAATPDDDAQPTGLTLGYRSRSTARSAALSDGDWEAEFDDSRLRLADDYQSW